MPEQLTDEKLQEIRARAEKATPGEWRQGVFLNLPKYRHMDEEWKEDQRQREAQLVFANFSYGDEGKGRVPILQSPKISPNWEHDVAFTAATDPPTVLALLDELETLRAHLRAAGITRPERLHVLTQRMAEEPPVEDHSKLIVWVGNARLALNACTGEDQ